MVMKKTNKYAVVQFVGNEKDYLIGVYCMGDEWLYCHACQEIGNHKCNRPKTPFFLKNKTYKAYFLDYCQGVRDVLEVETELGEVQTFIPLSDFKIISDNYGVLNDKYAIVVCINAEAHEDLTEGEQYKALRQKDKFFYILDNSGDCYYYKKELFKVIEDKDEILNENV